MSFQSFLVLGPESSGTRLATRILIANGCIGDDGHVQRYDPWHLPGRWPVVIRRSLPHGGQWPDVVRMIRALTEHGEVGIVITVRERTATIASQLANGHVRTVADAVRHYKRAMAMMGEVMQQFPASVYILPYEALVLHPQETERALACWAGLGLAHMIATYDGDIKHYKKGG